MVNVYNWRSGASQPRRSAGTICISICRFCRMFYITVYLVLSHAVMFYVFDERITRAVIIIQHPHQHHPAVARSCRLTTRSCTLSTRSCRLSTRSCLLPMRSCLLPMRSCRLPMRSCRLSTRSAGCQRVHVSTVSAV